MPFVKYQKFEFMKVSVFSFPSRISCPSFCPLKTLDEWRIMRFNSTHKIHPLIRYR